MQKLPAKTDCKRIKEDDAAHFYFKFKFLFHYYSFFVNKQVFIFYIYPSYMMLSLHEGWGRVMMSGVNTNKDILLNME